VEVVSMTKAWIVYESMFGNTREIARAVAQEIGSEGQVELHEVSEAGSPQTDVDLLVVGGPTHAFGLSRASTREDASRKSGRSVESGTLGLREWLQDLSPSGRRPAFATFDTRVSHPKLPGSAAKKASRRLRRLGLPEVSKPMTFWVHGLEGPLDDGELDRARAWARELLDGLSDQRVGQSV
jgi:hypothetical protein